jgi:hypothetical protein
MQKKPVQRSKIPFSNMAPGAWVNLALVVVLIFYGLQVALDLTNNKLCVNLAVDYCAYWSAGQISNAHGYGGMYDQELLIRYQAPLNPSADDPSMPARIIPFPYLPVFMVPFQLFGLLDLEISFVIYTIINLAGLILYLLWFSKQMSGRSLPLRLLLMCVLCTPVFLNLFWGQANILLGICVGEFIRAYLGGKPLRAGLWLGGLLFKPLLLILILPALLVQRSFKTLAGFLAMLGGLLLISYAMIGLTGFQSLIDILFASAQGGSASNPGIMMNWRMLGHHLTPATSAQLGWAVIITGTLLTAIATWFLVRKSHLPDQAKTAISLLGVFAATGALSWHAHFPQTIVLLPLFVLISLQNQSAERLFRFWVFTPIILTICTSILAIATQNAVNTASFIQLQTGLTGLILNLVVLGWAIQTNIRLDSPR